MATIKLPAQRIRQVAADLSVPVVESLDGYIGCSVITAEGVGVTFVATEQTPGVHALDELVLLQAGIGGAA